MSSVRNLDVSVQQNPVFFVFSLNHHKVELSLREQLKLTEDKKALLNEELRSCDGLQEYLILDTCNRWELYGVAVDLSFLNEIWEIVGGHFSVTLKKLNTVVTSYKESRAIQHLFEVSSGVDSQMVGETEIFGQVKASFAKGLERHKIGSVLHKTFSKAFQSSKWVRTNTAIGRGTISIGNVSVDLANRIFGDLSKTKVLVIGSGEVGRLTAQALRSRSVNSIAFTSRTQANAQKLCDEIGGDVLDYASIGEYLGGFDIVITSTSAPDYVLQREIFKKAMSKRPYRPLFVIDLAMPRDVDPKVGKLAQVFLYNLDDVSKIANENLENRSQEIEECKKVLSRKAWTVWLDLRRRHHFRCLQDEDSPIEELGVRS